MKNYVYIIAALFLFSCSQEEEQEIELDCDCDKVVQVQEFTIPPSYYFGKYWTVNECTGLQFMHDWIGLQNKPNIGDCK
jgi:hypothetical protein